MYRYEQADVKKINKCLNFDDTTDDDKEFLKKYLEKKCEKGFKVLYKPGKNSFEKLGRLYAPLGLQMLSRKTRNYIANEYYYDIDIRNAQPSILDHLFQLFDIECPELSQYCEDRDTFLKEYNVDKHYFMMMMYDKNAKPTIKFFRKIHNAIYNDFVPYIKEHKTYAPLWNSIKASKKRDLKDNKEGCLVSIALQISENFILQKMVKFFEDKGFQVDSLIFDGFLVKKDERLTDDILRECEDYIYEAEEFNGVQITLLKKPMDDVIDIPDDVSDLIVGTSDSEIASGFMEFTKRHLYWNKNYYYCGNNGIWKIDEEGQNLMEAVTSEEFEEFIKSDLSALKETKYYKNVEFMLKKKLAKPLKEFDFDKNGDLIAATNGVYDLEKNEFRKIIPEDYISKSVRYDFALEDDLEVQTKIKKLFKSFYENDEVTEYVLKVLSTGIVGKVCHQNFYIFTGVGSNGKSVIGFLMDNTLNLTKTDGYCGSLDASYWTEKPNNSNNASPTLHGIKGARACFSSEPDDGDSSTTPTVRSNNIKRITSGIDALTTRDLHEKSTTWYPTCTLYLLCNAIPGCTDTGVAWIRRPRIINHPFYFTDNVIDPVTQRKAEDLSFLIELKYRQQFLRILIQYYQEHIKDKKEQSIPMPESVKNATKEYFDDNDDVQMFLDARIVRSDNDVLFADMFDAFRQHTGSSMSRKKFSATMKSKGYKTKKSNQLYFSGVSLVCIVSRKDVMLDNKYSNISK